MKPDRSKSSALKNMPLPTDIFTLQAFLALTITNFVLNMHVLRIPLNPLLR